MSRISSAEAELWRLAVRDVAPLRRRDLGLLRNPHAQAGEDRAQPHALGDRPGTAQIAEPAIPVRPPAQMPPLDRLAGVDRATAERVRRGRYPVEAKLDLHGMTQAEAHAALARFVAGSRLVGRRCVLVVTGHGRTSGGVLKAAVPRWLAEPALRPHLLLIAPARPMHGGDGAVYVLLRKAEAAWGGCAGRNPSHGRARNGR
jgi:DNA-nicking Smr family endonuclease